MAHRTITSDGYVVETNDGLEYHFETEGHEATLEHVHDQQGEGRQPSELPDAVSDALHEVGVEEIWTPLDFIDSGGQDDASEDAAEDEGEDTEEPGVEAIDGVGPSRAEELREAGLETPDDVLDAGVDGLVEAGLSEGVAENIVENA